MHPMQVRIARHTDRLEEVVRFYRDQLGIPEGGRFEAHAGYDGVVIDLPGTNAHPEFTTAAPTARRRPTPSRCWNRGVGDAIGRRADDVAAAEVQHGR
jgi:hypothetical protein